jgi:hypothetical protein
LAQELIGEQHLLEMKEDSLEEQSRGRDGWNLQKRFCLHHPSVVDGRHYWRIKTKGGR